ncbi:MAG: ribonuclease P protein component [bacterium]|nr:ribonuclease P protein component [bacterium]
MKEFGLNKEEHIRSRKEVEQVFQQGKIQANPYLKIFYKENSLAWSRFGIIINKKFGNAVERNRAKRHIRELYRMNKNKLVSKSDRLFFIKNEFKSIPFREKEKAFLELLERSRDGA